MYVITVRLLISILIILLFLFYPKTGIAQNYEIKDTSYFVPWDDDYNLIISADKSDVANVKLLIKRGANVNATTFEGVTPLMFATQNGNLDMVKFLVENNADINKKPISGATALMDASKQNNYEIAEYLVRKGADLDILDDNGVAAVHYAAAYNNFDIMDMLIFYGSDKDLSDIQGNTPIIIATYNNCFEAADLLIQNGADLNATDNNGFSALMVAIQQGNIEIVDLLFEKGADVNLANKAGMTALGFAIANKNDSIVEQLVERGADVNHKTNMGITMLEIAKKTRDKEIIDFLQSRDAKGTSSPSFDRISVGTVFDLNFTDYMNGIQTGILDSKYKLGIYSGFIFRPSANRIMTEISGITYQFWERRYLLYLGLEKRFDIFRTSKDAQSGLFLGINEVLTFGGYRGSTINPKVRLITSPFAGWYLNRNWWSIKAGYEYLNFKTPEIDPGRMTLTFSANFGRLKQRLSIKRIDWLN